MEDVRRGVGVSEFLSNSLRRGFYSFNNKKAMRMKEEITTAAAKAAPPVAVTSSQVIFDLTLNQWVSIATLIYLGLQAFFLVRNEIRRRKE